MSALSSVPNQVGTMVLSSHGEVITSSGELADKAAAAKNFTQMMQAAAQITGDEKMKRLSVVGNGYFYAAVVNDEKINVVKCKQ
eukprot:m.57176 g.57176  ORF g.57176 m.57176 type:complete len:84 (-) comp13439_c0_seq1:2631-2882(-)